MMAIRENMGLSRKELSGLIGYRPSTIKNYEFCNPSRAYWLKFKSFVKDFYSGNETASN
jgi:transcriptional regulator with XRE-family HTH domain